MISYRTVGRKSEKLLIGILNVNFVLFCAIDKSRRKSGQGKTDGSNLLAALRQADDKVVITSA